MKKTVYFVNSKKGGIGKSVLVFLAAAKNPAAIILDLDDATKTSSRQLAYRKPIFVSFLDPQTKRTDRNAFNTLFESIINVEKEVFLADLGASCSEQLPEYFIKNIASNIHEALISNDIDLRLICIVGGGNNFVATTEYLEELVASVEHHFPITVMVNEHFPLSIEQKKTLESFVEFHQLPLRYFDLLSDKGETGMRLAEEVLLSGKGLSNLSPFKAIYFKNGLDNLNIL